MPIWLFMDYLEANGGNPVADWILALPEEAQAAIDNRLLLMRGMVRWPEKWASRYRGWDDLIELRISANRVQYRPLGVYQPKYWFVLLGGSIEKGGRLPRNDLEVVDRRRKELQREPSRVRRHHFYG
jgi:hypothetical protein